MPDLSDAQVEERWVASGVEGASGTVFMEGNAGTARIALEDPLPPLKGGGEKSQSGLEGFEALAVFAGLGVGADAFENGNGSGQGGRDFGRGRARGLSDQHLDSGQPVF